MAKKSSFNPQKQILTANILALFNKFPNKAFNYKQVAAQSGFKDNVEKVLVADCLSELYSQGAIVEVERGKYKLKPVHKYLQGVIQVIASGGGYVTVEGEKEDIYISPNNVKHALNGDTVKVYLLAKKRDRRVEGEVVDVITRSKTEFVGTLQVSPKFAFLAPDNKNMAVDIFIPLNALNGAKDGQKAMAKIEEWPKNAKNPTGSIIKILGYPGENNAEMNAILIEYGLPTEFPKDVEHDAEQIDITISEEEIAKRRDFRKITTFTIDPHDAKDFDDALSYRKLPNGNYEIGVHIADVSHYVIPGTNLDDEALERATSVYLVDRVVPMLPEKLSNNVCSLRPHEEKLCFSAVFELDENADVINEWFGRTVILSDHRFTYEEAQEVIETGEGPFAAEILIMDKLAKKMRAVRFKNGAIGFEKVEVKFHLDEKGNPLGVYTKESKDSNKFIEDFMLLANRRVAEFIGKAKKDQKPKTFVYRVHDKPTADKLTTFAAFAGRFGYKMNLQSDKSVTKSLNDLMKDVHGKAEQNVIEQLAIRTMAKAIYTTQNIGHYGLGFEYYTHFTSPIRRYPDVMVHRLLQHYLDGGKSVSEQQYEEWCKHSTEMEILASRAERDSIKYKQVQFLQNRIGETFDGIISGVTEWGMYVELNDNKCEGLIRLRDLDDDFYELDEKNFCIVGSRTKKRYQLGDAIRVQLKHTDLTKKQITFSLVKTATQNLPKFEDEFGFNVPVKKGGGKYRRK